VNPIDAGLLLLTVLSVLVGAWRGLVREVFGLAGWVVSAVLAMKFARVLGEHLPFGAGVPGVRTAVGAVAIVIVCTLAASLLGRLLQGAMKAIRLGGADHALGAFFGAVRAAAIGLVVATVVVHTGLAQRAIWKSSVAAPWLEAALRFASPAFVPSMERSASMTGA
jgi:membrane protein required for colicin V production